MYLMPDYNTWLVFNWEDMPDTKIARLICDVNSVDGLPFQGDRSNPKRNSQAHGKPGFTSFNIGPEPEFSSSSN